MTSSAGGRLTGVRKKRRGRGRSPWQEEIIIRRRLSLEANQEGTGRARGGGDDDDGGRERERGVGEDRTRKIAVLENLSATARSFFTESPVARPLRCTRRTQLFELTRDDQGQALTKSNWILLPARGARSSSKRGAREAEDPIRGAPSVKATQTGLRHRARFSREARRVAHERVYSPVGTTRSAVHATVGRADEREGGGERESSRDTGEGGEGIKEKVEIARGTTVERGGECAENAHIRARSLLFREPSPRP